MKNLEARTAAAQAVLDGRIIASAEYGEHIDITCVVHPTLRWNTKNIEHIGARTLFAQGEECECPMDYLIPVVNS